MRRAAKLGRLRRKNSPATQAGEVFHVGVPAAANNQGAPAAAFVGRAGHEIARMGPTALTCGGSDTSEGSSGQHIEVARIWPTPAVAFGRIWAKPSRNRATLAETAETWSSAGNQWRKSNQSRSASPNFGRFARRLAAIGPNWVELPECVPRPRRARSERACRI